jgi:hypothetical protein
MLRFVVQALQKIRHANIIKLKEVIREDNILYMIFEVSSSSPDVSLILDLVSD